MSPSHIMLQNSQTPQQQSFSIEYSTHRTEQKRRIVHLSKIGALLILTLGAAFILGQYLSYSFYENVFSLPDVALPLVITFAFFLTFLFLSVLFIQNKKLLVIMALGSCVAIVVSFFSISHLPLLFGTAMCMLLFIYAVFETKAELNTRIKIRFVHSLSSVTTKVVLAIGVLLASMFYGVFMTKEIDENNFLMPRSVFQKALPLAQGATRSVFGEVDFSKSLRQNAEERVQELAGETASPQARQQATEAAIREMQDAFRGSLGIEVNPSVALSDAVYDGLLQKVNSTSTSQRSWILIALGILFIFSMQALSVLIRVALIPIAFVVYEILLRLKFAHIVYENTSKEIVTL